MKLSLAALATRGQVEREARNSMAARVAAVPRETHELPAAGGEDPLQLALDGPLGHAEMRRDLRSLLALRMQRRDLALPVGKPGQDRSGCRFDLRRFLALNHSLLGVRRRPRAPRRVALE